ncbi:MAG: outer membrane beta-barrel protein [Saprospiraceae bacterium]|nr:outer membrane beta-barrel protein [Saprospiraceae bacterium]
MKYFVLIAALLFSTIGVKAQSVGVRAGLNYSKFSGPLEVGESYGYSNGFHFGVNYGYKFTNKFMLRFELLYSQTGSKTNFDGNSYYLIYLADGRTVFERGKSTIDLDVSNGIIGMPIVAAYQLHPKLEIFGCFAFNFLVNPIGRGTLRFESDQNPNNITFRQSLDYRYYNDEPKSASQLSNLGSARPITILVEGNRVGIPKYAGAYYQELNKDDSKFNWFDITGTVGMNYFINRGFYMGARFNYGFLDITKTKADRSLINLNEDNSYIRRKDKDVTTGIEVGIGFRF